MAGYAWMCTEVYGCAWMCMDMLGYVWNCILLHGLLRTLHGGAQSVVETSGDYREPLPAILNHSELWFELFP